MSIDIKSILGEYDAADDFGFSAISEADYNSKLEEAVTQAEYDASSITANGYRKRLTEVEKLIIPFLSQMLKTADKEYIYWPNRKPIIEAQIEKILKLTRS